MTVRPSKAMAREIAARNPRPLPDAVQRELASSGSRSPSATGSSREETVKIKGKIAFSLTRRGGRVTVKFGKTIDRGFQQEVGDAIKEAAERLLSKRLGSQLNGLFQRVKNRFECGPGKHRRKPGPDFQRVENRRPDAGRASI